MKRDPDKLLQQYKERREKILKLYAERLEAHLKHLFNGKPRIDRICARAKSVDSFMGKAQKVVEGAFKYEDPINQIQDQVGARIVAYYRSDVPRVSDEVNAYFKPIEDQTIVPDDDSAFGYFGKHYILLTPTDLYDEALTREVAPLFFELQIKTLFQHAWAEAEHDLGYKPGVDLTPEQNRKIAFTAAQAWGADQMFEELLRELRPPS